MRQFLRVLSLSAAVIGGSLVAACQAPLPDVEGWRPLTGEEAKALTQARLAESPEQPAPVTAIHADFNADGKDDRVVLLVNDKDDQFAPYLFDGAGAAPSPLARGDSRRDMFHYSLAAMPAGAAYGMCTETARSESDCEGDKAAKGAVILFYEVDNGGRLFFWNGYSFVERTIHKGSNSVSQAAPADEHPLARHPWWVRQSPMQRNPDLPTFHKVSG